MAFKGARSRESLTCKGHEVKGKEELTEKKGKHHQDSQQFDLSEGEFEKWKALKRVKAGKGG